jgi:hypothetical protein
MFLFFSLLFNQNSVGVHLHFSPQISLIAHPTDPQPALAKPPSQSPARSPPAALVSKEGLRRRRRPPASDLAVILLLLVCRSSSWASSASFFSLVTNSSLALSFFLLDPFVSGTDRARMELFFFSLQLCRADAPIPPD